MQDRLPCNVQMLRSLRHSALPSCKVHSVPVLRVATLHRQITVAVAKPHKDTIRLCARDLADVVKLSKLNGLRVRAGSNGCCQLETSVGSGVWEDVRLPKQQYTRLLEEALKPSSE